MLRYVKKAEINFKNANTENETGSATTGKWTGLDVYERASSVILDIQTLEIGYGQPTVSLYAASNLNTAFLVAKNTSQAADGYNTIVTLLLFKHPDILQSYLFILSNTLCQCPMSNVLMFECLNPEIYWHSEHSIKPLNLHFRIS